MAESAVELAKQLSESERRILRAFPTTPGAVPIATIAQAAQATEQETYSALSWLAKKGLVELSETVEGTLHAGREAASFVQERFPERRVYERVVRNPEGILLDELKRELPPAVVDVALTWWKRKGLGTIERTERGNKLQAHPSPPPAEDEQLLATLLPRLAEGVREADAKALSGRGYEALRQRPGILDLRQVKQRAAKLTPMGHEALKGLSTSADVVGELTPEMLVSGAWRGKEFQSYDLRTAAKRPEAAKPHPVVQIIEQIRDIFVELGFTEIEEDFVQSAFWNLDALFIPQDHPARDMQDTFYLSRPAALDVPQDLFERLDAVHKSGKGTRSRGWGRGLEMDESRKALLRTHTTVGTIRYLAKNPKPPVRVFSIGRVFRHETMDATHLPEFHQVEGIATEEGADLPMLLGILREFYGRMGFPQVRLRPSYYPYTEPSLDVEVWYNDKWLELGGAGIFRPEVTVPLGVETPVLAWGLGLERLAMLRLKRKDIRDLYVSDLDWLRRQPLL